MPTANATQLPTAPQDTPARVPPSRREVHPHIAHILAHFERLKGGHMTVLEPNEVYLGHEEGSFFWELICFRMAGHPHPQLGCMRFRRHEFPGKLFARESLAAYLSSPPSGFVEAGLAVPVGALPVLLPRTTESIAGFLHNLAAGKPTQPVYVDPTMIELAWDFRTYNPYGIDTLKHRAGPLRDRLMRTARGHVIRGMSHELIQPQVVDQRFVAIKDPVQLTPKGRITLPPLAVNRSFLAISADISEQNTRLAAANWSPFSLVAAEKRHVLLG